MTIYVKDSSTWQRVQEIYVKNSGSREQIDQGLSVNDSSTWRETHPVGTQEYSTAGAHSFTVPDGVYHITLSAAGGGGGAAGAYYSTAGQGGGGAGYADSVSAECTPGSTITISVGTGGAGVKFGDSFCPCNGYAGTDTTVSGLTVSGNITASTVTLGGGAGGKGATQAGYPAVNGGTTSGITGGTTGQTGQGSGGSGRGGKSLGGAFDTNGYGTAQGIIGCYGYNGDSAFGTAKGAGGCGTGDPSGCDSGWGGNGSVGYVLLEWNNAYI